MDKGGGGLTLDPKTFIGGSGSLKRRHPTDSGIVGGFEFPIAFACREATPPSSHEEKRVIVGEMDFFSGDKRARAAPTPPDLDLTIKKEDLTINTGLRLANARSDQSTVDDEASLSNYEEGKDGKSELAVMQAELGRMTEENQKLRGMLSQVTENYNALQMHLIAFMQQRSHQNINHPPQNHEAVLDDEKKHRHGVVAMPRQFMDLGLAAEADEPSTHSSTEGGSQDRSSSPAHKEMVAFSRGANSGDGRGSAREESPEDSSQGWTPSKKAELAGTVGSKPVDQAPEATMRKARVSVRARSDAPMINDGCQWRKYGQKMAKGNPCPRAYYRCTMATGCPVRKQVQRCAEDRSILITTYEGNHNHPLPPAAMPLASTTSAAATMLLSGSMPSTDGLMNSNFLARTILPCSSSMATISASAPFPTVTLDLTQTPTPLPFQRPPPHFQVPFHGASLPLPPPPQPPSLPQVFGQTLYNQSKFSGLHMSVPPPDASKSGGAAPHNLSDTVSAATAAITADPNFTAALAAAITSIIGGGAHQTGSSNNGGNNTAVKTNNGGGKPAGWSFPAT